MCVCVCVVYTIGVSEECWLFGERNQRRALWTRRWWRRFAGFISGRENSDDEKKCVCVGA